jgi:protein-L-isoaspartate(D-aspartate) O-methyltransferase
MNQQELVDNLREIGIIHSDKVYQVMKQVNRAHYCPSSCDYPYQDAPQYIGYGATISAPHMHAFCLELLQEKLVNVC